MPQFKMASDKEDVFKEPDSFRQKVEQLIPNEPPALIRGDLRLSNYLLNLENKPCFLGLVVTHPLFEIDLTILVLRRS
jgi:hypothetical protein